ncbi:hypothetical protein [Streptococcus salivarius]|uniref:hypothetical protein n=1 Tax=Streptococcus salivarius TaxID=1304 RepID=UPI00189B84FF|nr:hypothetical protein [Streptococcus salivarius]DAS60698.1 MAG TPA: Sporulation protein Cse60 [Caudoviricetes sp.]
MRKVKIFITNKSSQLDETINKWIEENGFELLDVRTACNIDMNYGIVQYTATVIYREGNEG